MKTLDVFHSPSKRKFSFGIRVRCKQLKWNYSIIELYVTAFSSREYCSRWKCSTFYGIQVLLNWKWKLKRGRAFILMLEAVRIIYAHYTDNTFALTSQSHSSFNRAHLRTCAHSSFISQGKWQTRISHSSIACSIARCSVSAMRIFIFPRRFSLGLALWILNCDNFNRNLVARHSRNHLRLRPQTAESRSGNLDIKALIYPFWVLSVLQFTNGLLLWS